MLLQNIRIHASGQRRKYGATRAGHARVQAVLCQPINGLGNGWAQARGRYLQVVMAKGVRRGTIGKVAQARGGGGARQVGRGKDGGGGKPGCRFGNDKARRR